MAYEYLNIIEKQSQLETLLASKIGIAQYTLELEQGFFRPAQRFFSLF
jgi:hypothetical protein